MLQLNQPASAALDDTNNDSTIAGSAGGVSRCDQSTCWEDYIALHLYCALSELCWVDSQIGPSGSES